MHHAASESKQRAPKTKPAQQRRAITYLSGLLAQRRDDLQGLCHFLPSVMSLSRTLNCSAVEIHMAMKKLSEQGYRFLTLGLDSPVTVSVPSA